MAIVTWATKHKATVQPKNSKAFKITIKKSPGGLSFGLYDSGNQLIKSAGEIEDLQLFAREYYRYH